MEEERIYFKLVDQVAKETEAHIITEFGSLNDCELALRRNRAEVAERMAHYGIRLANKRGRYGSSAGPNIHLIRKPDENHIPPRAYSNMYNTFCSQMERSLQKTFNSLKRLQTSGRPGTKRPNDAGEA